MTAVLTLNSVSLSRPEIDVLVDIDLVVAESTRLAVIGPNGVGKSTLLSIMAGLLEPTSGSVTLAPPNARVGLVRQELDRTTTATVREILAEEAGVAVAMREFEAATAALADPDAAERVADRYDTALTAWLESGATDFDARLGAIADGLGLSSEVLDRQPATLSGGQAARVGLAALELSRYDITLLDEPTNDLDADGLARLDQWVASRAGGVVLVSHDRAFLERTVTSVLEIDEHHHTASLFNGGWEAFLTERATQRSHAEERYGGYVSERDRLKGRAQTQREWADQGASRAKKNPSDPDKNIRAHNIAQTEKLAGKARATEKMIERLEVVEKPWEGWDLRFSIAESKRSGSDVAVFEQSVIERGDFHLGPFDLAIDWAERVALVGPNGSGKSSIIGAMLGRIELAAGSVRLGSGVVVGELDQSRFAFNAEDKDLVTIFSELAEQLPNECRSVLAKFGLDAEAVQRPAVSLSPGERTRAQLALFQARGVNLLVLDEPTNHLDLPAIEQLEQALESYTGTLIVVTHDRQFGQAVSVSRTIDVAQLGQNREPV